MDLLHPGAIRLTLALLIQATLFTEARAVICEGISEAEGSSITSIRIVTGLTRPLYLTAPPGDTQRLFVLEQDGRIRIIKNGILLPDPFLAIGALTRSPADLGGNEEGLLGMAFDPDYATSGFFYVYHTTANGSSNVVARYERSGSDPDAADPNSREVVISVAHPSNDNHNGGMIAFGPSDGLLYIGTGDGGGFCDSPGNAQNGSSNLGKILRIDVSSLPYTIPADNPFVPAFDPGDLVNDEIWALGLRNPWRFSFAGPLAGGTGDLFIGDVGQFEWEEIDYQAASSPGGENYGWDKYEGFHCPNPSCGSPDCSVTNHVLPVLEYANGTGGTCSVSGGYVYGGCRIPALRGRYFYADFCAAFIKSFRIQGGAAVDPNDHTSDLSAGGALGSISSFGEDARGELYVVDRGFTAGTGEIYKIEPVFTSLQVSGTGADPFILGPDWSWEDLGLTTAHPVSAYRVYRTAGNGSGTFDCVHETAGTTWPGGDPSAPPPGGVYSYIVTALETGGDETGPGTGSGGGTRTLSAGACP